MEGRTPAGGGSWSPELASKMARRHWPLHLRAARRLVVVGCEWTNGELGIRVRLRVRVRD